MLLGKDVIKHNALRNLGYHSGSINLAYYDWAILEHDFRRPYLTRLIQNALMGGALGVPR